MLKVTVAEVQRSILKQFGINSAPLINSGNFSTGILSQNALPLTAAAGLGNAMPALARHARHSDGLTCATAGYLRLQRSGQLSATPVVNTIFRTGNTQIAAALRALERDGLVRTLAEPNLTAVSGETAKFLAGGEYPIPVVDSDGKLSVHLQGVRCRPGLHAGGDVGGPHQPQDRDRGERADRRRRGRADSASPSPRSRSARPSRRSSCLRAARWPSPA